MRTICVDDYPQLSALCWSRVVRTVYESEAFQIYESGWRFIEKDHLSSDEQELISGLAERYGKGVLNV